MPIRRAREKSRAIADLSGLVPAGERFVTCLQAETGPRSRFYSQVLDPIPGLGLAMVLTRMFYFFTLTDESVVVNSAARWSNDPGDVVASFPRGAFPISSYNPSAQWPAFDILFPGAAKPVTLSVHPMWRTELDQLAAAAKPARPDGVPQQAELPALVDEGLRMVGERLDASPGFQVYVSVRRQLEYLNEIMASGQPPTAEKIDSLTLGVYATREFETSDPAFAHVLFDIQYLAARMHG
jgi:Tsi6